jgi:ATPase subunit of ABC transporter with duplicated ATPase domains
VRPQFGPEVTLHVAGPERIALTGPNGAGKTSVLRTITGELPPAAGRVRLGVPARLLPQRLGTLDPALTVAQNVARFAPQASPNTIRANLARMLFTGDRADQRAATLSGGELFRATLAALLLAEPAPQLLMLDEPTNNLDLPSVSQLTSTLRCFRGALLVVSHDAAFLRELGLTRWLSLDGDLSEIDPL